MQLNYIKIFLLTFLTTAALSAMEMGPAAEQKFIEKPITIALYNYTNSDFVIEGQPILIPAGQGFVTRLNFNYINENNEAIVSLSIRSKALSEPITITIEKKFRGDDLMLETTIDFDNGKSLSKSIQINPNAKFYNIIFYIKGNKQNNFEGSDMIVSASNQSMGM
jgi:hypothetical protein